MVEWANEALDTVRRKSWRDAVARCHHMTNLAREIHAIEKLRLIIHMHDVEEARHALQRFFWRATHSRIKEIVRFLYRICDEPKQNLAILFLTVLLSTASFLFNTIFI